MNEVYIYLRDRLFKYCDPDTKTISNKKALYVLGIACHIPRKDQGKVLVDLERVGMLKRINKRTLQIDL